MLLVAVVKVGPQWKEHGGPQEPRTALANNTQQVNVDLGPGPMEVNRASILDEPASGLSQPPVRAQGGHTGAPAL